MIPAHPRPYGLGVASADLCLPVDAQRGVIRDPVGDAAPTYGRNEHRYQ